MLANVRIRKHSLINLAYYILGKYLIYSLGVQNIQDDWLFIRAVNHPIKIHFK